MRVAPPVAMGTTRAGGVLGAVTFSCCLLVSLASTAHAGRASSIRLGRTLTPKLIIQAKTTPAVWEASRIGEAGTVRVGRITNWPQPDQQMVFRGWKYDDVRSEGHKHVIAAKLAKIILHGQAYMNDPKSRFERERRRLMDGFATEFRGARSWSRFQPVSMPEIVRLARMLDRAGQLGYSVGMDTKPNQIVEGFLVDFDEVQPLEPRLAQHDNKWFFQTVMAMMKHGPDIPTTIVDFDAPARWQAVTRYGYRMPNPNSPPTRGNDIPRGKL